MYAMRSRCAGWWSEWCLGERYLKPGVRCLISQRHADGRLRCQTTVPGLRESCFRPSSCRRRSETSCLPQAYLHEKRVIALLQVLQVTARVRVLRAARAGALRLVAAWPACGPVRGLAWRWLRLLP